MEIKREVSGNKEVFEIIGRLDTTTAPELEKAVSSISDGIKNVVFDFKGLEYISSAGLRVLLKTQKQYSADGEFMIENVNEDIMEVFEITGFNDILTIK